MAPHSSTLAWKIPWMEEPGKLQSMESLRVGHDWATSVSRSTFHFHALEKAMATHSSVLAWRIPGTGEPGALPSTGSHRVGHDWSDAAAAAAAAEIQTGQCGSTKRNVRNCLLSSEKPPEGGCTWASLKVCQETCWIKNRGKARQKMECKDREDHWRNSKWLPNTRGNRVSTDEPETRTKARWRWKASALSCKGWQDMGWQVWEWHDHTCI